MFILFKMYLLIHFLSFKHQQIMYFIFVEHEIHKAYSYSYSLFSLFHFILPKATYVTGIFFDLAGPAKCNGPAINVLCVFHAQAKSQHHLVCNKHNVGMRGNTNA